MIAVERAIVVPWWMLAPLPGVVAWHRFVAPRLIQRRRAAARGRSDDLVSFHHSWTALEGRTSAPALALRGAGGRCRSTAFAHEHSPWSHGDHGRHYLRKHVAAKAVCSELSRAGVGRHGHSRYSSPAGTHDPLRLRRSAGKPGRHRDRTYSKRGPRCLHAVRPVQCSPLNLTSRRTRRPRKAIRIQYAPRL
jgi:hypothetical protein